jgi:hypothetical protein
MGTIVDRPIESVSRPFGDLLVARQKIKGRDLCV